MSVSTISTGWNRFWFAPRSTASVAVLRIAYGALVTAWMLSMAPMLSAFYGEGGAVPTYSVRPIGAWSVLDLVGGHAGLWVVWSLGVLGAIALTVGWRTRLAAVVVFVVLVSLMRDASPVFNGGDTLMKVLAFYMVLLPAGSALSLDARRDGVPSGTFPRRAPWALRLVQIQLSIVYLATVWEKLKGEAWRDGTAVSYALRVGNVNRVPAPAWLTDSPFLMQAATYSTLVLEVAIAVLVWNRRARPWVLGMGVLLHLSIEVSLVVGFFGLAMLTLYLAFLPPESAEKVLRRIRERRTRNTRRTIERTTDDPSSDGTGKPGTALVLDHTAKGVVHSS